MHDLNNESVVNIDRCKILFTVHYLLPDAETNRKIALSRECFKIHLLFPFSIRSKVANRKSKKRGEEEKTYGTVYNDIWNPPRRTAVDQNPLYRAFSRKGK